MTLGKSPTQKTEESSLFIPLSDITLFDALPTTRPLGYTGFITKKGTYKNKTVILKILDIPTPHFNSDFALRSSAECLTSLHSNANGSSIPTHEDPPTHAIPPSSLIVQQDTSEVSHSQPGMSLNTSTLSLDQQKQALTAELRKMMAQSDKSERITRFIGFILEKHAVVMEHMSEGSLRNYMGQHAAVAWSPHRYTLAADIAEGMAYLHSKLSIHSQRKPKLLHHMLTSSNILLYTDTNSGMRAKISDYGLYGIRRLYRQEEDVIIKKPDLGHTLMGMIRSGSRRMTEVLQRSSVAGDELRESQSTHDSGKSAQQGIRDIYKAPEAFHRPSMDASNAQKSSVYYMESDVYSFGIILLELAFWSSVESELERAVGHLDECLTRALTPFKVSTTIKRCLHADYSRRPPFIEIARYLSAALTAPGHAKKSSGETLTDRPSLAIHSSMPTYSKESLRHTEDFRINMIRKTSISSPATVSKIPPVEKTNGPEPAVILKANATIKSSKLKVKRSKRAKAIQMIVSLIVIGAIVGISVGLSKGSLGSVTHDETKH